MIYAMSDINGQYAKYRAMLQAIGLRPDDTLYVLGDVVDRGPEPMRVLQDMMSRANVIPILGNHEFMAAYHEILERNRGVYSSEVISIKLSLLRDLRESGDWENWNDIREEIYKKAHLDREQYQQLQWEECLCAMAQYHFQELIHQLECWETPSSMPL